MTTEEFHQLVKKSPSFQSMSPLEQVRILNARGQHMEGLINIFSEEQTLLQNAATDLYDKSEKVVTDFKAQAKQDKRTKWKTAESNEKLKENQITSKLLEMLRKL